MRYRATYRYVARYICDLFTCDLTYSVGSFGSVSVDDEFEVTVDRGIADVNDTLILEDGNLSVVTEDNEYELLAMS